MKITVSGLPGSGCTTVSKTLCDELDLNYIGMGEIIREVAEERGVTIEEMNEIMEDDERIDEDLDMMQRRIGQREDDIVVDSRLGFYFIPDAFHVFLQVSSLESVRRIINDDSRKVMGNYQEIKTEIKDRVASEKRRYDELYGVDYTDETNYDLVVDTDDKRVTDVVSIIEEGVGDVED